MTSKRVHMVDYGAGNVRSLRNAVESLGFSIVNVDSAKDFLEAEMVIFPGVGAFGSAVGGLKKRGLWSALQQYLGSGKPFLGICVGLQVLLQGSEESKDEQGFGLIPGRLKRFPAGDASVPHMGWNQVSLQKPSSLLCPDDHVYFVHSYYVEPDDCPSEWILSLTNHGNRRFVSAVEKDNIVALQFHPEKSGQAGLALLRRFLERQTEPTFVSADPSKPTQLSHRIIACLDVRSDDTGELVVTKGDQYNVRGDQGQVRNLGGPVQLAANYSQDGADEIVFLNITGFRNCPLSDAPLARVIVEASEQVFVPLTVGGGIRDYTDANNRRWTAVDVASYYFRAGADKVSLGSVAVKEAEVFVASGMVKTGTTAIECISVAYGAQAVVVSIDPRRVYVKQRQDTPQHCIRSRIAGPNGEQYCWYQCTVDGGRTGRPIGAYEVAIAVEALGAGEILLNCIDRDGTNAGFDLELVHMIKAAVSIPVIASSGAGCPRHFEEVLAAPVCADAALAAGIFHRGHVSIRSVKQHLRTKNVAVRPVL